MGTTVQALKQAFSLGYRPVGILSAEGTAPHHNVEGVPVLGGVELAPHLAQRGVSVALMESSQKSERTLGFLQQHFEHVIVAGEYGTLPSEPVQMCNRGGVLGVEYTNNLLRWQNRFIKRLIDIAVSGILL